MIQIPANINDATTGHKLQGMSKDVIVVSSWPTGGLATMFKNWEYAVLSRVRTLSGLYLVEPIDMDKSFQPSSELNKYIENAGQKETDVLEIRKCATAQLNWLENNKLHLLYNNRREVLSEALFSSFEFCANGFVDDTDDRQTFYFGKNLL